MADLSSKRALDFGIGEMAQFITNSFEGYFVPVIMTGANLLARVRVDSIDLAESRVVMADDGVVGAALIARRGWASRVAAMGIVPEWRGRGVGKFLMNDLLRDAEQRGDHELVLEVIAQNPAAIHLYENAGFRKVRRLVGFRMAGGEVAHAAALDDVDPRELGRLIAVHGLPDLPWQLSSETIAQFTRPYRAYRLGNAFAMISDPEAQDVRIYSLLVEPTARHKGSARQILQAIMAQNPGKAWHVPAIFPEEMAETFEAVGFVREELSQWQMSRGMGNG